MVHAAGSLLFIVALVAALAVIAGQFHACWRPMVAALRALRLGGVHPPAAPGPMLRAGGPLLSYRPTVPARAPAPWRAYGA
jgi:hypothetical protein